MHGTNKNTNVFDNVIKEKLKHYSLPLDDTLWGEIEKRLNKKPGKKVLWLWISSAAAVAVIVLGGLIFLYNNKFTDDGTTGQLPDYETQVTKEIPDEENLSTVLPSNHRDQRNAYSRQTGRKTVETKPVPDFDVNEPQASVADLPAAEQPASQKELPYKLPANNYDTIVYAAVSQKETSLAFHIGSGGALWAMSDRASNNSDFFSYAEAEKIVSNAPLPLRPALLTGEDFSEREHYPPLSFGLTFKKDINNRFAVESGLVYTFLSSRFENKESNKSATLKLHYLGVPLNLHTKITGSRWSKWGLYLATGIMLEKGLWSHYSQSEHFLNSVENISFTQKIDGWQWSLNAAFGIEYKLIKNYGIYFEPKVSYYLKNNQPESARTENPLIIGINAGVRYSW
ncbi:MAG: PorT family protein [Dysgonamonadaceae bacterium]|jgi:hypothetical protein|nr:PorT family protein [Dysgonamonadaceae bacterium]